jgi:lipopolysaccharide/colanic/teichoic acid biosynthesis glycosyltransferase
MHLPSKLIAFRSHLVTLLEAVLPATCYTAALFILMPDADMYLEFEGGFARLLAIIATFLIAAYLFDFYRQTQGRPHLLVLELCQLVGGILLFQAAIAFVNPDLVLPQSVVLLGSLFLLLLLIPWWLFVRPALWNSFGMQRAIFIGSTPAAEAVAAAYLRHPDMGVSVAGYIAAPGENVSGRVLGPPEEFDRIVSEVRPGHIIVASSVRNDKRLLARLLELKSAGVSVNTASQAYERVFGRIDCRGLDPYIFVFLDEVSARPARLALQAIYTNLLGLIAAVIAVPVITLLVIALRLTDRGPAMKTLRCITLHGIPFDMFRFRCAPERNDFLGRFLRRYRIDGLPQIFNIIRGEMSLIGPRAERIEFDAVLHGLLPFYRYRQYVKPGVFGWSQLLCDPQPEDNAIARIEYDLYYIKHVSVAMDMYIILRALRYLLSSRRSEGRNEVAAAATHAA